MSLIISENSMESMLNAAIYILGVFSSETKERYAIVHIATEQDAENFGQFLVDEIPRNERKRMVIIDNPDKCKPLAREENNYNKLVEFINDNCIFNEYKSIKGSELSSEFTKSTGIPVDIRRGFPKMMAQFMETRLDISKETTCKGVIYEGLALLPEEDRILNLRIRAPTSKNISDISRGNSETYAQILQGNSVQDSQQNSLNDDQKIVSHISISNIPQNNDSNKIPTIDYNSDQSTNVIKIPRLERPSITTLEQRSPIITIGYN
jgi:hypothetical protein